LLPRAASRTLARANQGCRDAMNKTRLEAFSDGVLAIIITIMVLELKVPHGADWAALQTLWPVLLSYILSFVYVAIYWNNHHHMLHACRRVTAGVMWGNMHLLFWLSLLPFVTGWMGENHFAQLPVMIYGAILLMAAISFSVLQHAIIAANGDDHTLADAIGADAKGKLSVVFYALGIALAVLYPWAGCAAYLVPAMMWLIPDTRIARLFERSDK
jgi:uncharacterized membrane protein